MSEPRDDLDDRVELTDLDVITRYSLAVRNAKADREELITVLRSDLAWLEQGRRARPAVTPARRPTKSATRSQAKTPAKTPTKAATKKSAARRSR
jgi:hypothetical protein